MRKIIAICILAALLILATFLYAQQDVTVRVMLDKETLVRNGQHLIVYLYDKNDELTVIQAENPYYSIYEYIAKIPAGVWSRASEIAFEIGQVRRDDYLFIKSISAKQPFYSELQFSGADICNDVFKAISAEAGISNGNLLSLKVTATRAHSAAMDTPGPGFSIPKDMLGGRSISILTYLLIVLAIIAIWAVIVFAVSDKVYKQIPIIRNMFTNIIKTITAIDICILLLGIPAPVLYFYGSSLFNNYDESIFHIISSATIALIIIKIISRNKTIDKKQNDGVNQLSLLPNENATGLFSIKSEWKPYIFLILFSLLVYIPAVFPNPYFNNDEHQVINAARSYLREGNFDSYNRAWLHSWMVTQAVRYFGDSTVATRLISALFGIFFIVSAYHIIKKMSNQKDIALLSAVLLLFNPYLIQIFTTVRMYAIMLPISFWLFYCIYMTLHREINYKRNNAFTRFISANFNFHFGYALITIPLIFLNYHIHINSMMLLLTTALYVIVIAIISKKRKYINLFLAGIFLISLAAAAYFIHIKTDINIQFIDSIVNSITLHSGIGRYNYIYFWTNIDTPIGLYFGIFFISFAFGMCAYTIKKASFLLYPVVCYIITVIFFVFYADRYYEYVYMSFLAPVTIMLISAGYKQVMKKVDISTRLVIGISVAAAIIMQISFVFADYYIDNPERTKFDRPYEIFLNDIKIEELESVAFYRTYVRYYLRSVIGDDINIRDRGNINQSQYQIRTMYRNIDQPVIYFISEKEKMFHASSAYKHFLDTATEVVTHIDAAVIHKMHFIVASPDNAVSDGDITEVNDNAVFTISDVMWDGDVAYLRCSMDYISDFKGAAFVAIEIAEQGLAQSATHKYQILLPEDFKTTDKLYYELPVRPKTEEYSENISFSAEYWAYIYYGENTSDEIFISLN